MIETVAFASSFLGRPNRSYALVERARVRLTGNLHLRYAACDRVRISVIRAFAFTSKNNAVFCEVHKINFNVPSLVLNACLLHRSSLTVSFNQKLLNKSKLNAI